MSSWLPMVSRAAVALAMCERTSRRRQSELLQLSSHLPLVNLTGCSPCRTFWIGNNDDLEVGEGVERRTSIKGFSIDQPHLSGPVSGIKTTESTLRRSVELASGKYALVEKSREFILVPRCPVLERRIGKRVLGVMGGGISWTIGR